MKSYNTEHCQPTDTHYFLFGGFNLKPNIYIFLAATCQWTLQHKCWLVSEYRDLNQIALEVVSDNVQVLHQNEGHGHEVLIVPFGQLWQLYHDTIESDIHDYTCTSAAQQQQHDVEMYSKSSKIVLVHPLWYSPKNTC